MRDLLIFSDSHEQSLRVERLIEYRQSLLGDGDVLEVIFLGDGLNGVFQCRQYGSFILHAVRGNCDYNAIYSPFGEEIPFSRLITVGTHRVLITHGHLFSVKHTTVEICREASRLGADIVLFGHTHVPRLEYIKKGTIYGVDRDLTLFNPGALGAYDGSFGNLSLSDDGFLLSHGRYANIMKK